MNRVLITGGNGLVGSALKEFAEDNWYFACSKDADLTDYQQTHQLFEKHKPQLVIHLAADVGGLFKNMDYSADMCSNNLAMAINVLKCCWEFNVQKTISCLSTCIFPDSVKYPITADQLHNGPPHPSNEGYAYAKRMIDVLSKAYNKKAQQENKNIFFTTVTPTNIYGPHDNFREGESHVVPALIIRAKNSIDGKLELCGTGKPLRQFVYSRDVAKIIHWAIFHYISPETLIIAPNVEYKISELAEIISKKFDLVPEFNGEKSQDGQYQKTADGKKIFDYLPKFRYTTLQEGIDKTVEWLKNTDATIRL